MNKIINIKWNKETFALEVIEDNTVADLKLMISKLKQLGPERQKLLLKGKFLDDSYGVNQIPDSSTITLIGTVVSEIETVKEGLSVKFVEDLTEKEKADLLRTKGEELKFGLTNLGNTCYFNATIQCLGRVPELRSALKILSKNGKFQGSMGEAFAKTLGNVYYQLDNAADTVTPSQLVQVLRTLNPLFAEAEKGNYKQQDAEECWSFVFNTLREILPTENKDELFSSYLMEELFGIEVLSQLKNVEVEEEKDKKEVVFKLPCFIDANTNELVQGLKDSLKENIELFSDTLERNTTWVKTSLINRLPPYLNIQFMRFFWKQAASYGASQGGKAKILKSVIFSKIIDLYDLCSLETQKLLDVGRAEEEKLVKNDNTYRIGDLNYFKDKDNSNMMPTGRYRLISVLTHKGRSSESGHYIGWTGNNEEKWTKFDDDIISIVKDQSILELKGGGDNDIAYICLFQRLEVPFTE